MNVEITSGTPGIVNLVSFVVLNLFFIGTSALMIARRDIAPVKGHSCVMIAICGVGGYASLGINFNILNYIGGENYPCPLNFWTFMAIVPLYCFPNFLICTDLYNKYIMGETLLLLGQEKVKAITQAPNKLAEVTKKLKLIRFFNSPLARALKLVVIFIPAVIFALVIYNIGGDGYWDAGNYNCQISDVVLIAYILLSIVYIVVSVGLVIKLRNVHDAFGIKQEILWAMGVHLASLLLYIPCIVVQPLNDALTAVGFDPTWLIIFMMVINHLILCVRPLVESYGIHISCANRLPTIMENEITLEMVLAEPEGVKFFALHLIREFSTENIEFWKEVNAYRAAGLIDPKSCVTRANYLMENFVNPQSPNWVNLPDNVRLAVTNEVKSGDVTPTTFDNAQKEILILMGKDSFPRFKRGTLFKEFIGSPHVMSHMRVVKSDHQKNPDSGRSGRGSKPAELLHISVLLSSHRDNDPAAGGAASMGTSEGISANGKNANKRSENDGSTRSK